MSKIYVIKKNSCEYNWSYGNTDVNVSIIGVFTSKDLAEKYVEKYNESPDEEGYISMEEVDVDALDIGVSPW